MARIEVGIVLRVAPGAPPVVIGAVADDELLRHALRLAINAAVRREVKDAMTLETLANCPPTFM